MRPGDANLVERLDEGLQTFHGQQHPLPGIQQQGRRTVLIEQMVESHRRVRFVRAIRMRDVSPQRADPGCDLFDPLKAAIHFQRLGNVDEAFWMVFFFVHFGKNARGGWRYARDVYGSLGGPRRWDWATTSADPEGFRDWLHENQGMIRGQGAPGGFGNHRKFQSLNARRPRRHWCRLRQLRELGPAGRRSPGVDTTGYAECRRRLWNSLPHPLLRHARCFQFWETCPVWTI